MFNMDKPKLFKYYVFKFLSLPKLTIKNIYVYYIDYILHITYYVLFM